MDIRFTCGEKTTKGGLCRRAVGSRGEKCHLHTVKQTKVISAPQQDFSSQIRTLIDENLRLKKSQKELLERVSYLEEKIYQKQTKTSEKVPEKPKGDCGKVPSWETFEGEGRGFKACDEQTSSEFLVYEKYLSSTLANSQDWLKGVDESLDSILKDFLPVS